MYETYSLKNSVLIDNVKRDKENIEKSVILGFEKIKGTNDKVLDGYYDIGQQLKLTQKGKEILNGYRLARNELILEDYRKNLTEKFLSLSNHLY